MDKPLIRKDVSIEDYHADKEYISASSIKEAKKSMRCFHHYRNNTQERKDHFDMGNAFELALLDYFNGTEDFVHKVAVFDESKKPQPDKDYRTKENSEWKSNFFETNKNKYIISTQDNENIKAMISNCELDSTVCALLKNTDYQTSLYWTDEKTGVKIKTRPDVMKVNRPVIVDVKTTKDASPKMFAKDCANYDYPTQAIIQIRGAIETGLFTQVDKYYWIVVENNAPFDVVIYEFNKEYWEMCDTSLDYTLNKIKNNEIKGYSERADNKYGIITLELPKYYEF